MLHVLTPVLDQLPALELEDEIPVSAFPCCKGPLPQPTRAAPPDSFSPLLFRQVVGVLDPLEENPGKPGIALGAANCGRPFE